MDEKTKEGCWTLISSKQTSKSCCLTMSLDQRESWTFFFTLSWASTNIEHCSSKHCFPHLSFQEDSFNTSESVLSPHLSASIMPGNNHRWSSLLTKIYNKQELRRKQGIISRTSRQEWMITFLQNWSASLEKNSLKILK